MFLVPSTGSKLSRSAVNFRNVFRKHELLKQRVVVCQLSKKMSNSNEGGSQSGTFTKQELKERLTPLQYHVTQEKGTERPFTGEYEKNKQKGIYNCVVCGNLLFKSDHKYESGSGWPSFYKTAEENAVERITDASHGMRRVEVVCDKCKAHLGHVFPDGPKQTGERYCMNSASLSFVKSKK